MFVKIVTFALLTFIIATSEGKEVWDGLTARWSEDTSNGFYDLPQNLIDAEKNGWTKVRGLKMPSNITGRAYHSDPTFTLLFDENNNKVIGFQIGLLVADIERTGVPIDYNHNSAITQKTLNCKKYYTATAYFQQDEKKNIRQLRLLVDGKMVEIPTKTDLVSSKTPYYSKRCVTRMGHHYYQIDRNSDCGNLFPWFLLIVRKDVIGLGFQVIGKSTSGLMRTWYEEIPPAQLGYTIPDAPACIGEGIAKYGLSSLHVWFKKNPEDIHCSDECTAKIGKESKSDGENKSNKRSKDTGEPTGNVC